MADEYQFKIITDIELDQNVGCFRFTKVKTRPIKWRQKTFEKENGLEITNADLDKRHVPHLVSEYLTELLPRLEDLKQSEPILYPPQTVSLYQIYVAGNYPQEASPKSAVRTVSADEAQDKK